MRTIGVANVRPLCGIAAVAIAGAFGCSGAPEDPAASHGAPAGGPVPGGWVLHAAPHPSPSPAYRWLDTALEATARDVDRYGARPTVLSRSLGMVVTAMYDAWACYDERAVASRLGGSQRRPAAERTDDHRAAAIGHAVVAVLADLHPEDDAWLREQAKAQGLDLDAKTPAAEVGRAVAQSILAHRRHDGSNQHGDEPGGDGTRYGDTTGYRPVNAPDRIAEPDRWLPIPFDDGKGGVKWPGFLTPHWGQVKPFALDRADRFRAPPFPKVGTEQLAREVDECIAFNAGLTLEQKAIVEFMRDGPRSTGQSGHWLRFAQDVSRRDGYGLEQDVKLFFCVGNVAMDAFIASWETKRHYDSTRPYWYVRLLRGEEELEGWCGPGKGTARIRGKDWIPYSPATFPTPPFPGYVSGHSTVSAACARMLELFTGSDRFGAVERRLAGCLTEPDLEPSVIQRRNAGPAHADASAKTCEVELRLPTFTATAEMAGISRIMGGYHIQADNVEGLAMGKKVADSCWPVLRSYFDGTAKPRD